MVFTAIRNLLGTAVFISCLALSAAAAPATEEKTNSSKPVAPPTSQQTYVKLSEVIAGSHRTAEDVKRDKYRHPLQTLEFFGLKPTMTVVEIWPASGWYTDIIAPYLATGGGTFYAAHFDTKKMSPQFKIIRQRFTEKVSDTAVYGHVRITTFSTDGLPAATDGSADMVVSFRNFHNWMRDGWDDKAVKTIYQVLKPGGIFGIVEHRASEADPQDPKAASGYVREDEAIKRIEAAGFKLVATSAINNNPRDTKDYPFGVWTLPPTLRTEQPGESKNENFDSSPYLAIGESDRFTLKFVKPEVTN